ncbi:MAG: carbamoyl-phosphate synthase large subunit, partial [Chromatiales bacterium]|nr:carbamoyl-phosphate synthase large subunit [Chromatiales bacterium]
MGADVPITRGIDRPVSLLEAQAFFKSLGEGGAMMIKAVAGGGGRGSRAVFDATEVEEAFTRCQSEALTGFGRKDVFVEAFLPMARHVEVQILGDVHGAVAHLGERECSVQRRYQKIVEIAPAPNLDEVTRTDLIGAAVRFARHVGYTNLGTFEFLVDVSGNAASQPFVFIEANARLQVEHTVTEQVTGVDIVQTQIRLAEGVSISALGLDDDNVSKPRGYAIQARVNMETIQADGSVKPASGTLGVYEPPNGPSVRTDGFGYTGYVTSGLYDSLLAKVICHSPSADFSHAVARTRRALSEFRIEGVTTNLSFLANILDEDDLVAGKMHTRWVDDNLGTLTKHVSRPKRFAAGEGGPTHAIDGFAGARVDSSDPLALFAHDADVKSSQTNAPVDATGVMTGPDGSVGMTAPIQGTIVSISVAEGDAVLRGQPIAAVEAMKMEHVIKADVSGVVRQVTMAPNDVVREGFPIVFIEASDDGGAFDAGETQIDLDFIRPDLRESIDRHAYTLDENRSAAVEKRHGFGYRMPRENIAQLVDEDSFEEYWPLVVAFQHQRYDIDTLREKYPGDGVVAGTASINGRWFADDKSRAVIVHYDYTVLAGTQGRRNHYKQDRMFELAHRFQLPMILFAEGGGGRPGDDNVGPRVAFDTPTFTTFSKLSGLVPMVGINNGRCF